MTAALTKDEAKAVELLKVVRAHYSEEHVDLVLALIGMAPHAGWHKNRLPASAYRKGLIAGLSFDSQAANYPECPYDGMHGNYARGDNDPRQAWRDGSRDGIRIHDIVLWPNRTPVPGLQFREFKILPPELRQAHDSRRA